MAKAQPNPTKLKYQRWATLWRTILVLYALALISIAIYAVHATAVGYNTNDSCGNAVPGRPGVALVGCLLFIPAYVAIVCAFRWPPKRWWTTGLWIVGLAVLGAAAALFMALANLDICLA